MNPLEDIGNLLASRRQKIRKKIKRVFGSKEGEEVLEYLENRFEVHLPAFQGEKGKYDPLDAMRRDAHREIFLWIRHEANLAKKAEESEPLDYGDEPNE